MRNLKRVCMGAVAGVGVVGICLFAGAAEPAAQEKPVEIEGVYDCVGEVYRGNAGAAYRGSVTIRKVRDTYRIEWRIGEASAAHKGVAIRHKDVLASSWSTGQAGAGVVVYTIEAGPKLVGKYSPYPGDGRTRKETLTFVKGLAELPKPRAWQVGESALVNWSQDGYWYPATVAKKDGERYFVRFDDGDEEWTDGSLMLPQDIEVGDRVFGNWKKKGVYYPGTVTKKDGKIVHIEYDDGDEETTTVSFLRVLRPKVK